MKNALICIAKDEDNYIDEWAKYHLKLGYTKIFIYQNNWRYSGNELQKYNYQIELIEFDGEKMQMRAYNDFIDKHYMDYDFATFIDVDEFICLKKHYTIDMFLQDYEQFYGIGINWRCFGDNGLTEVIDNNYSLIDRFTKCEKVLDRHIKTTLNMKMCKNMFHFINPHFVDASMKFNVIADVSRQRVINGPWNYNAIDDTAQINHYNCKTFAEFKHKLTRGKADTEKSHPQYNYVEADFYKHNKNEIEDLTLYNFWHDIS